MGLLTNVLAIGRSSIHLTPFVAHDMKPIKQMFGLGIQIELQFSDRVAAVREDSNFPSMTKEEAAKFLEVSLRAVQRYVTTGKLTVSYVRGKRGKIADYDDQEVKTLKRELDGAKSLPMVGVEHKLLLTIEEAAAISGLTASEIEDGVEQGSLKTVKGKIKREELNRFVSSLFD